MTTTAEPLALTTTAASRADLARPVLAPSDSCPDIVPGDIDYHIREAFDQAVQAIGDQVKTWKAENAIARTQDPARFDAWLDEIRTEHALAVAHQIVAAHEMAAITA